MVEDAGIGTRPVPIRERCRTSCPQTLSSRARPSMRSRAASLSPGRMYGRGENRVYSRRCTSAIFPPPRYEAPSFHGSSTTSSFGAGRAAHFPSCGDRTPPRLVLRCGRVEQGAMFMSLSCSLVLLYSALVWGGAAVRHHRGQALDVISPNDLDLRGRVSRPPGSCGRVGASPATGRARS